MSEKLEDWVTRMAAKEDGQEISAGIRHPDRAHEARTVSEPDWKAMAWEMIESRENPRSGDRRDYLTTVIDTLRAAYAQGLAARDAEVLSLRAELDQMVGVASDMRAQLAARPLPAETVEAASASLAQMVIEWVDGSSHLNTDWKSGLKAIIAARLSRFTRQDAGEAGK